MRRSLCGDASARYGTQADCRPAPAAHSGNSSDYRARCRRPTIRKPRRGAQAGSRTRSVQTCGPGGRTFGRTPKSSGRLILCGIPLRLLVTHSGSLPAHRRAGATSLTNPPSSRRRRQQQRSRRHEDRRRSRPRAPQTAARSRRDSADAARTTWKGALYQMSCATTS
jgi:hypothetical protein